MKPTPSFRDVVQSMPRAMQKRFESLGGYVSAIANPPNGPERKLSSDEIHTIQFAALIYSMDGFMRTSTRAARHASASFEKLGMEGFAVGNTYFTKDNPNTRRGERLADALIASLQGTTILGLIRSAQTMNALVERMAARFRNE